jgi:hypothetical protein
MALDETLATAMAREEEAAIAERFHAEAREEEIKFRATARKAESKAQKLETQAATLSKILNAGTGSFWPPVLQLVGLPPCARAHNARAQGGKYPYFCARSEVRRQILETWLVVAGGVLWGAFPLVYSILFSAFYLPLLLMLAGLILRGVAFEYRSRTERMRWIWDAAFSGGSLVAALMQGATVGTHQTDRTALPPRPPWPAPRDRATKSWRREPHPPAPNQESA